MKFDECGDQVWKLKVHEFEDVYSWFLDLDWLDEELVVKSGQKAQNLQPPIRN